MHNGKGFLFTDARYHLVARGQIPESFEILDITKGFKKAWRSFLKTHKIKKVGFEGNSITLALWKNLKKISKGAKLIDVKNYLDEKRMVKKPLELYALKHAQKIAEEVFAKIKKRLRPGVTEKEVEWEIEKIAHDLGAQDLSFTPIVAFAEDSASPHNHNTDRKLKRGDLVLIDMGVRYNGFCSDMTRVIFTKQPTPEQRHVYGIVLAAQKTAIRNIKAGVTGRNMDKLARAVIKEEGYGKQFTHPLGHGVGLDIHELPSFTPKYKGKVPEGSVMTVEPGIYLPGKFGIRIEDMVLVTRKGNINLTKTPKDLKSCVIDI